MLSQTMRSSLLEGAARVRPSLTDSQLTTFLLPVTNHLEPGNKREHFVTVHEPVRGVALNRHHPTCFDRNVDGPVSFSLSAAADAETGCANTVHATEEKLRTRWESDSDSSGSNNEGLMV